MSTPHSTPPWVFNLEGTVLRFCGKDPDRPKSFLLEVEQEQIPIQLPKFLRPSLRQQVHIGDRVNCIGRSQIDWTTGVIKLKAYRLFSLPSERQHAPHSVAAVATTLNTPVLHQSPHPQDSPKSPSLKGAKILLCKKSGCQKRGGHQLGAALTQILQAHQLQDQVEIQYSGCQKCCSKAPSLTIMPGKHRYERLTLQSLPAIIEEHFCVP